MPEPCRGQDILAVKLWQRGQHVIGLDFQMPLWPGGSMQEDTYVEPADQALLDLDYSPSHLVESLDIYIDAYAAQSATVRQQMKGRASFGLRYGTHARHRLDFFPCGQRYAPTIVFIHGGFWSALDESHFSFPASAITMAGVNYVSLTYRLAPEASLSEIVLDGRLAIAWLIQNADNLGFDARRIVLVGHSAGAHLAAMAKTDVATIPVNALLISGVYDLAPVQRSYVNDTVSISDNEVRNLSPMYLAPVSGGVVDIIVGDIETPAFKYQSRQLYAVWQRTTAACTYEVIRACDHFDILFDLADPKSALFKRVLALCEGEASS